MHPFICTRYILFAFVLTYSNHLLGQVQDENSLKCYRPSQAFLQLEDENCYQVTRKEADKAFAQHCWDDAGKLYRAAKLCRDANQDNRNAMNTRIEACRKAAEEELQAEKDKAIQQARQAIASNRAKEAEAELQKNNRNTAYRLATFANDYIAPEGADNPDCVQVIMDATQDIRPAAANAAKIQPFSTFSYELADHLSSGTSIRFFHRQGHLMLIAFDPEAHIIYQWDGDNFKLAQAMAVDTTMERFDIAPNGETILLYNKNTYTLIREGKKTYSIKVALTGAYTFNPTGNFFYYYNRSQNNISALNITKAFAATANDANRKGASSANESNRKGAYSSNPLAELIDNIPIVAKGLAYKNGHIWCFSDIQLVVYNPDNVKKSATIQILDLPFPRSAAADSTQINSLFADTQKPVIYKVSQNGDALSVAVNWDGAQYTSRGYQDYPGNLTSISDECLLNTTDNGTNNLTFKGYDGRLNAITVDFPIYNSSTSFAVLGKGKPEQTNYDWLAATAMDQEGSIVIKLWRLNFSPASSVDSSAQVMAISSSNDGVYWARLLKNGDLQRSKNQGVYQRIAHFDMDTAQSIHPLLEVSASGWVAAALPELSHLYLTNGQQVRDFGTALNGYSMPIFNFDQAGNQFVYGTNDSVFVFQLDKHPMESKIFLSGYEYIKNLLFLPNTDQLLVVPHEYERFRGMRPLSASIVNTSATNPVFRSFPLTNYDIAQIVSNRAGNLLYLSNGIDIKGFSTANFTEETVNIRARQNTNILAYVFHPNDSVLAVGYSDNLIIFRNSQTGKKLFQIRVGGKKGPENADNQEITDLNFNEDASQIIAITNNNRVYKYDFDLALIARRLQIPGAQLTTFSAEQISDWELDEALDYEGNFTKLAKSNDLPLIRSFFAFYSQQSQNSNRLDDVKRYCERATDLFELMDPENQKAQSNAMLYMYNDYIRKLIQRDKITEAENIIRQIIKKPAFKSSSEILRNAAHVDLLKGNLQDAIRKYIEVEMNLYTFAQEDIYQFGQQNDFLVNEWNDFDKAGQLTADAKAALCYLGDQVFELPNDYCTANTQKFSLKDPASRMKWQIFKNRFQLSSQTNLSFAQKNNYINDLFGLLEQYKTLDRTDAGSIREKVLLEKSRILLTEGDAEQIAPLAYQHFTSSIQNLNKSGSLNNNLEQSRLLLLAESYLKRGSFNLYSHPNEAIKDYQSGISVMDNYYQRYPDFISGSNANELILGPLYLNLGKAQLFIQEPDSAISNFKNAGSVLIDGPNEIYFGHYFMMHNQDVDMYLSYGSINSESLLSNTLAEISQLAFYAPADTTAKRMQRQAAFIKATLLGSNPDWDSASISHMYYANMRRFYSYRANYDSCYSYSVKQLELSQSQLKQAIDTKSNKIYDWATSRTEAALNMAYFGLLVYHNNPLQLEYLVQLTNQEIDFSRNYYSNAKQYLPSNAGHAALMLGQPEEALKYYREFLDNVKYASFSGMDTLEKDWRDLAQYHIALPGLEDIKKSLKNTNSR